MFADDARVILSIEGEIVVLLRRAAVDTEIIVICEFTIFVLFLSVSQSLAPPFLL